MINKLNKYSRAQNISSDNNISSDANNPFSFSDWIKRNTGIIPGQEYEQYTEYVKQWHLNKEKESKTRDIIREKYINVLKYLALKLDDGDKWITNIDFDQNADIEQAIPFYAKKLKDIALYLVNKREAVRRAKIKYNLSGTYSSLERLFYEYILKSFTKNNNRIPDLDISNIQAIPELSAVNDKFQIFIEELYDDNVYFDRDPGVPLTSYFSFTPEVTTYLNNFDIATDDYEWLYSTGVSPLCADNPLLWTNNNILSGLPLSSFEAYNSDVLNDYNRIKISEKYLGETQYILSGGYWNDSTWIPISSSVLLDPINPYAHLSNRHYPTYATVPFVGGMYSMKDVGGFFLPRNLGISTAVAKRFTNVLCTSSIDNDFEKRGISAIYRDIDIFDSDSGFTHKKQNTPVLNIDTNAKWMKSSITDGQKSGCVLNARQHQEFTPYQTFFETNNTNNNGIFRQYENYIDPWIGELNNEWGGGSEFLDERGQYNVEKWHDVNNFADKYIYQWKVDIFGNQYAVFKDVGPGDSYYNKKNQIPGTLWVRTIDGVILNASIALSGVFNQIPSLNDIDDISLMVSQNPSVLDIDIFYDTLMIRTSSIVYLCRLDFDFSNGHIFSRASDINYISLENSKFGGTWLNEDAKTVTICTLLSSTNQIRPVLRLLNLDNSKINYIYNRENELTDISNYMPISYDHPVFTYDINNKLYNVSYLSYNEQKNGMYFTIINIDDRGHQSDIISCKTIIPKS